jgi:hypothetical protein
MYDQTHSKLYESTLLEMRDLNHYSLHPVLAF